MRKLLTMLLALLSACGTYTGPRSNCSWRHTRYVGMASNDTTITLVPVDSVLDCQQPTIAN